MLERELYQKALREEGSEESGDLEVIDDEEVADDADGPPEDDSLPGQASGDSRVPLSTGPSDTIPGKRRRPQIDPFAGLCTFAPSHLSALL